MTAALPIQLWKELRALLPWWAALLPTVAILGAAHHLQRDPRTGGSFIVAAGFVYIAGAAALGGLSFGHDYANRTLGPLLALPVSRKRLLGLKVAVLVPLLGLMGLVAQFTLGLQNSVFHRGADFSEPAYRMVILGPMLAGALVAPWFTMVARGPLAGAVFAVAIPLLIWMICDSFRLGSDVVWRITLVLAALGGVMTVRTFIRQESIDGAHADLTLPAWLRRSDRDVAVPRTDPAGWVGIALLKELRLQQMTFVVAGLFVAAWAAILFARWANPANEYLGPSLYAVSSLYLGVVGIMAGALPAAEERRFGTADWQLLMPVAAWKQWALKCAVAISLAMILTLGLPALLKRLLPAPDVQFYWQMVFGVLYFSVTGLYLSSISPTGLRAILGTAPALAAITVTGAALFQPLGGAIRALAWSVAVDWVRPGSITRQTAMATSNALFALFAAGLSLLVLTLAFHNHRSADRSRRRIVRQVAVVLTAAALATLMLTVVGMFMVAGVTTAR